MRVSVSTLLALPLFAVSAQAQFEQYQDQLQTYLNKFASYIPNTNRVDAADAAEAKTGEKKMSVLTLDNWQQTLYEPVAPGTTQPEEWWVLITGRNKTCFGRCDQVNAAFNETAIKFATLPESEVPHMAYLNCDDQPVLCNIFSVGPASLWAMDMLPPGNEINIWGKRLNTTTTTTQDLLDLYADKEKSEFKLVTHVFHPFNGWFAQNGLSVAVAYVLWFFTVVPNWTIMLLVSFASRSMMNRRMPGQ
ncbi:hypothetical protein SODALDRAFT_326601 [Sodiomyces alkalinus F11]|uniref:Peptidyl-tRNA hydrolase n=1 Tax=Sodiomyces alkalinus (strain CBS 110278 / VKM F-3762 / F11) TaxID=1314773 RepID=A0A3N2Q6Q3_SODAK|nr:hypothetical protein SODALDRAFT_326601 [Sodiomyces alkalinus F11]ROT42444.1 hypothetical protein SODALDRAFT_326601 [Sodiomyces alkalinus F11]